MGGDSLTLACTLRRDAIETTQIQALCDTGASGYVFIDSRLASDFCRHYRWKLQQLPHPIYPKGYDGTKGSPITQYLTFILEIDGRRIYDLPMLVIGLGSHDLIIGRNFFHDLRICIDVFHRRLRWPKEFPPTNSYSRTLATYTRDGIRPVPVDWQAQRDMFRRDRLIERNDKRRRDGVHIKVLTHELVKELPKPVQSGVVADTGPSVTTDLSEVAAMARGSVKSCAAPPLISKPATKPPPPPATELLGVPQEKTTVLRTKGTTWKRQNQQDLAKMERELNRPNNYQSTS
jgi:predicted aspartyl protease